MQGHQLFYILHTGLLRQQLEKLVAGEGDDGYLDARIKFLQHQVEKFNTECLHSEVTRLLHDTC